MLNPRKCTAIFLETDILGKTGEQKIHLLWECCGCYSALFTDGVHILAQEIQCWHIAFWKLFNEIFFGFIALLGKFMLNNRGVENAVVSNTLFIVVRTHKPREESVQCTLIFGTFFLCSTSLSLISIALLLFW